MSKRRSPVWQYFTAGENDRQATCKVCSGKVSRGGQSVKTFSTTNLTGHLRKHPAEYKKYEDDKNKTEQQLQESRRSAPLKQLTLQESSSRTKVWESSDPRAIDITTKVAEMISLDCQPFSIVNDVGFIRLLQAAEPRYTLPSRRHITETVLPKVHSRVMSKVQHELSEAKSISFTSDIWSTEVSNDSLISLTAHWLSPASFKRKAAMLNASSIPGSHTGDAIRQKCESMLDGWGIQRNQLHCFVVDNAANMKKAMVDGGYTYIGCFAHTLQLVIHDGVLTQRYVLDVLSKCRRIVGHFKHSQVAISRLKDIQSNLGLPHLRLKQDVATRWNSTLYMLESIAVQKVVLAAYTTEYDDIPQLSSHQLDIIQKVITVLKPVEDITQSISSDKASISIIIPYVRALARSWENCSNDRGIQTMKTEMLASLNRRFINMESNETLVLATMLDPCFKDKYFSGTVEKEEAKKLLIEKVIENMVDTSHDESSEANIQPPEKRPRTEMMKCFEEILEEASIDMPSSRSSSTSIVEKYLAEPNLHYHSGNAYAWWADGNRLRFPILGNLALKYLSPPPTSVPSERLFSTAGDIYDEKRNRLAPERAETLLFIKNNFN